jgi:hypothetical protein
MPPFAKQLADESESTYSGRSGEKRARKTVRFAVEINVRHVQHWSHYVVDRSILWFTPGEILQIAERDRLIVEFMRQGRFHETDEHSSRGLSIDSAQDLRIRQMSAAILLAEQFRQLASGHYRPDELAEMSRTISRDHVQLALKRAESDLLASIQFMLESLSQYRAESVNGPRDRWKRNSSKTFASSHSDGTTSTQSKVLSRPELSPRRKQDAAVFSGSRLEYAEMSETCSSENNNLPLLDMDLPWVSCGEWIGHRSFMESTPTPRSNRWSIWDGALELLQSSAWVSCGTWSTVA